MPGIEQHISESHGFPNVGSPHACVLELKHVFLLTDTPLGFYGEKILLYAWNCLSSRKHTEKSGS